MRSGGPTREKVKANDQVDAALLRIPLYVCVAFIASSGCLNPKKTYTHTRTHISLPFLKNTFDLIGSAINSPRSLALALLRLHGYNLCPWFWTGWLGGWWYCGL